MTAERSRRTVLLSAASAIGAVAGCAEDPTTDAATDRTATPTKSDPATSTTRSDSPRTGTDAAIGSQRNDGLDVHEANVVGVSFEGVGGNEYRFDVTLLHDDDGEDGYANWWQVEAPDGTQLGRRTLLHPHGTREFTRSETISVPDAHDCVVVRGHDQTHGYGGQVVLASLVSGTTRPVSQGANRRSFDDACPTASGR